MKPSDKMVKYDRIGIIPTKKMKNDEDGNKEEFSISRFLGDQSLKIKHFMRKSGETHHEKYKKGVELVAN